MEVAASFSFAALDAGRLSLALPGGDPQLRVGPGSSARYFIDVVLEPDASFQNPARLPTTTASETA